MIELISRRVSSAAVIAITVIAATAVRADDPGQSQQANSYNVNVLVSDIPINGMNPTIDKVLQNSWGVAFSPAGSPFWIADNATGCSTLYTGDGTKVSILMQVGVSIPLPPPPPAGNVPMTSCQTVDPKNPPTNAAPTGVIWNPSSAFAVPGTSPPIQASFIWATEDGTLSAWAGGLTPNPTNAVIAVDNSGSGAVYKGLAYGVNINGFFLFATNFNAGTVDVFGPPSTPGGLFTTATTDGGFIDPDIPAGYAPFGIESIDGNLFVSYALQNGAKHDDVKGPGHGFIDVFDTDGHLLRRFASQGVLNSPWGMTRASFAFGRFSGDILVGNFGNGRVHVFNSQGKFIDKLDQPNGKPVVIDGLWKLTLGGGRASSPDTLYFTAGPNDEKDGQFGTITPVSGQ